MCTSKELALICDATVRVWALLSYSRGSAAHTSWGCTTGSPAQFISFAWKPVQIVDCAAIRCHPDQDPWKILEELWFFFRKFRTSGPGCFIRSLQEGLVVYLSHLRYQFSHSFNREVTIEYDPICCLDFVSSLKLANMQTHTHIHILPPAMFHPERMRSVRLLMPM